MLEINVAYLHMIPKTTFYNYQIGVQGHIDNLYAGGTQSIFWHTFTQTLHTNQQSKIRNMHATFAGKKHQSDKFIYALLDTNASKNNLLT